MFNRLKLQFLFFFAILMFTETSWANQKDFLDEPRFSYCSSENIGYSLEKALDCQYSQKPISASLKLSKKVRWIRIDVPSTSDTKDFFIKIEPFLLNKIDLYYQTDGNWKRIKTGASEPVNPELASVAGYQIKVPASPALVSTYYLAITSPSLSYASISIDELSNKAKIFKQNQNIGFGLQLGILIAILVFSLVSYTLNPSITMGRFCLFTAILLLCTLVGSGLIMQVFLPNQPKLNEILFHSLLCLRVAMWVWVMQSLLSLYKTPKWYVKSCVIIYVLIAVGILIYPLLGTTLLSSLVVTLYPLAPLLNICATNQTVDIPKPFKLILNSGFFITILLFSLTMISLIVSTEPDSRIPLYLTRLTDFVTPLLMLGIITYRNRLVHRELEEVKLALNDATIRAEYEKKSLLDRQTLIDMFAHELKNPLTSISLAVHGLADNTYPNIAGAKRRITNINRSIKDMDEIIERCNLMNSLDNKKIVLEKNAIDLKKFIRQILTNLDAKNIVMVDVASNIELSTDAKFLRIIFTNLIQNALKYSVPNSKVKIIAKQLPGLIKIEFLNEVSPSMVPDEADIFTRFYRHPMAHEHRGAGLGLFLTKEMCKLIGGEIFYSERQGLINFSVEIPV